VKKAFSFGIVSLVAGTVLYVAMTLVALNYYDEQPRPAWLTTFWMIGVALVVGGLLVMVNGAVRAFRERA